MKNERKAGREQQQQLVIHRRSAGVKPTGTDRAKEPRPVPEPEPPRSGGCAAWVAVFVVFEGVKEACYWQRGVHSKAPCILTRRSALQLGKNEKNNITIIKNRRRPYSNAARTHACLQHPPASRFRTRNMEMILLKIRVIIAPLPPPPPPPPPPPTIND